MTDRSCPGYEQLPPAQLLMQPSHVCPQLPPPHVSVHFASPLHCCVQLPPVHETVHVDPASHV
jgi:hypothetical protein